MTYASTTTLNTIRAANPRAGRRTDLMIRISNRAYYRTMMRLIRAQLLLNDAARLARTK